MMTDDIDSVLDHADVLVIGNKSSEFESILDKINDEQVVIDLVRITVNMSQKGRYEGICW
jgi:GDP-mannose 6-dehydrogenase